MLSQLLNTPCVVTRKLASATIDDYGNEIPETDEINTVCAVQQVQRDEPGGAGELSVTRWLAFFPAGTVLRTGDSFEAGGSVYELTGDPWPVMNLRTRAESHVEATAVLTRGSEEEGS